MPLVYQQLGRLYLIEVASYWTFLLYGLALLSLPDSLFFQHIVLIGQAFGTNDHLIGLFYTVLGAVGLSYRWHRLLLLRNATNILLASMWIGYALGAQFNAYLLSEPKVATFIFTVPIALCLLSVSLRMPWNQH